MSDIDEIRELIGFEATHALIKHQKGCRLYIPARPTPAGQHPLETIIGRDNLMELIHALGGLQIHIPLGSTARYRFLESEACKLAAQGLSQEQIIARLRVSRSSVQRWLKGQGRLRPDDGQLLLDFDFMASSEAMNKP